MTTEKSDSYYVLRTLGCKANLYDSQLIEAELQKRGWKPLPTSGAVDSNDAVSPLLCIVNSCTVTDEADRQSRKMASRLGRENPAARVVVTGCGAEVDPERIARSQGIHYVVGNQSKPQMVGLILEKLKIDQATQGHSDAAKAKTGEWLGEVLGSVTGYSDLISRHPMDREWPAVENSFFTPPTALQGQSAKTRAFLKIQEGCNSFCTYCIIPYGRGPSRSLRPREVVEQVRALVEEGIREVVITGTNIGDYGVDWGLDPNAALAELFELMLGETKLERLRVSSLDPTEITPALLALMQREPRFCPHFHVSLQAAQSRILKLMKRKYALEQVQECLLRIEGIPAPLGGAFVGMDVITGFPGETDQEFEASVQVLESLPWSRLHVFPYSERSGTPATRLPGAVKQVDRLGRARRLNELSLTRLQSHYQKALDASRSRDTSFTQILLEKPSHRVPAGCESLAEKSLAEIRAKHGENEKLVWASGYTTNYLKVTIPMAESQANSQRNQLISAKPFALSIDVQGHDVALLAHQQSQ